MTNITTSEFNQTLLEMLCDNENEGDNMKEENICLISKMPLENDPVTLYCKHSFNYYLEHLSLQKLYTSFEFSRE